MRLSTPSFWYDTNAPGAQAKAMALSSFSALYGFGHALHQKMARPQTAALPVLCIGNLVAGGGGKTPVALAVMALIQTEKLAASPCFLTRGYGGTHAGPVLVDPAIHTAAQVGDEALLLARAAPVIVAANRMGGATMARARGHDLIVMDDGLHNTRLKPDFSIVVIDGQAGFGNGLLLPAGPLRTPVHRGMKRADAVLLLGDDRHNVLQNIPPEIPALHAYATPLPPAAPAQAYLAFCGIARPEKFRASLQSCGLNIAEFVPFPDHYVFTKTDVQKLAARAQTIKARLITTAKDAVRFIGVDEFDILGLAIAWDGDCAKTLTRMIKTTIQNHGQKFQR